jgi:hypothetical protein
MSGGITAHLWLQSWFPLLTTTCTVLYGGMCRAE